MKTILQLCLIFILAVAGYVVYTRGWNWAEEQGVKGVAQETAKEIKESDTLKKIWCGKDGCK